MFILRKISSSGVEMNFNLGDRYTIILKESNPKDYEEAENNDSYLKDPLFYGFISCEDGQILVLSSSQQNYIMTESGNTFANVTL